MKLIAPLLLLLLLACSNAPEQSALPFFEPEPFTHTRADSLKIKIFAEISRASRDTLLMQRNQQFDTLLKYVDIYQDSIDKLIIAEQLISHIHHQNTIAIDSLKLVKLENTKVKTELKKTKQLYSLSNADVHSAREEASNLKKKFSHPTIAGVTIDCYGFKTRFLKQPLQFKTDVAKEIKRIVINFIVPENELIEKKNYVFTIKISGLLNKSIVIKLTGEEMPIEPIVLDMIDRVREGDHLFTIECNGKPEYSKTLKFK
jgi:hypothetical protein